MTRPGRLLGGAVLVATVAAGPATASPIVPVIDVPLIHLGVAYEEATGWNALGGLHLGGPRLGREPALVGIDAALGARGVRLSAGLSGFVGESSLHLLGVRGSFVNHFGSGAPGSGQTRLAAELEYSFATLVFVSGGLELPLGGSGAPSPVWRAGVRVPVWLLFLD